ncbi:MAG TPA: GNAT family N-acetyltransferase [Anaerolineales bacterium]|nr:GNAT family N-acetyltransferase [Anaerolineales bacterium]
MAEISNELRLKIPTKINEQAIFEIANTIDIFDSGDIDTIKELWDEFITKGDIDSWYHFIAAEVSGEVVGFACFGKRPLTRGTFDLYWIAVQYKKHNIGIGTFLVNQVESIVSDSGGHLLIAETSGKEAFESTRKFYIRRGFGLEGRIRDFYDIGDDLCIFTRHLANSSIR